MSVWAASLCTQDSGIWVPLTFSLLHSRFCCRGQWPFIAWNQESPWHWECPGLVSWPMFLIGPQFLHLKPKKGFPGGSVVKNHLLRQETWIRSLGQEDPLEKEMATCSTILAWEIPWTGELQSWSLTELNTTKQLNTTDWKTIPFIQLTISKKYCFILNQYQESFQLSPSTFTKLWQGPLNSPPRCNQTRPRRKLEHSSLPGSTKATFHLLLSLCKWYGEPGLLRSLSSNRDLPQRAQNVSQLA